MKSFNVITKCLIGIIAIFISFFYIFSGDNGDFFPSQTYKTNLELSKKIREIFLNNSNCIQVFKVPNTFMSLFNATDIGQFDKRIKLSSPVVLMSSDREKVLMFKIAISEKRNVADLYYNKIYLKIDKDRCSFLF